MKIETRLVSHAKTLPHSSSIKMLNLLQINLPVENIMHCWLYILLYLHLKYKQNQTLIVFGFAYILDGDFWKNLWLEIIRF